MELVDERYNVAGRLEANELNVRRAGFCKNRASLSQRDLILPLD